MSNERNADFECPQCGSCKTYCLDSRHPPGAKRRRRRRQCAKCEHRFSTVEIPDAEYRAMLERCDLADTIRQKLAADPDITRFCAGTSGSG